MLCILLGILPKALEERCCKLCREAWANMKRTDLHGIRNFRAVTSLRNTDKNTGLGVDLSALWAGVHETLYCRALAMKREGYLWVCLETVKRDSDFLKTENSVECTESHTLGETGLSMDPAFYERTGGILMQARKPSRLRGGYRSGLKALLSGLQCLRCRH